MKRIYSTLIAILMVSLLTSSLFAKVPRRMLMEDHTGAWCGWCVLGNQAMEDMLAKYGDKFIPVALHNGDKMVVGNIQGTLASKLGITGYPSGTLNRMPVTAGGKTAVPVHPIYWEQVCAQYVNDESIADVDVTYNIDKAKKLLTATVTCTLTEDYNGQLAFNLFVMADDLTGSGTGWDQANYLSGNSSYKNHPYYSLPNPVKNYLHQNVMIAMPGGALGENALFPESPAVKGKKYEKTFTVDLSNNVLCQNIDKVWVVGLVQESGAKYSILNSKSAGKKMPMPKYGVQAKVEENYLNANLNSKVTKAIEFVNNNNVDLTVEFSIDQASVTTPSSWNNSLDVQTAEIKAGKSQIVNFSCDVSAAPAYGSLSINAKVKDDTEGKYTGLISNSKVGILSSGLQGVIYHFDDGRLQPIQDVLNTLTDVKAVTAIIPYNDNVIQTYSNYPFKVIMVIETFNSRGMLINLDPLYSYLNSAIKKGTPVLMTSMIDMFFIAGNYASLIPNAVTANFFNNVWGISGPVQANPFTIGNSSTGVFNATAIVGCDPLTNGMSFNINEYNATSHPYYTNWADQITILDSKLATPIFKYNVASLPEENKIAGVKIITPTNKNIYLGFTFDLMANKVVRTTLMGNLINWLVGETDVEEFNNLNSSNLTVSPNPTVSFSNINYELQNDAKSSDVYLVDVNGNRVKNLFNGSLNAGKHSFKVNLNDLSSGNYYVISNIDGRYSQTPLIIAK